jgi:hypothetical protein
MIIPGQLPLAVMGSEGEMANALINITNLKSWKNGKNAPYQGVVKRDWVPTGRIDFATSLNGNDNPDQPSEFRLLVELSRALLEMKILRFNGGPPH